MPCGRQGRIPEADEEETGGIHQRFCHRSLLVIHHHIDVDDPNARLLVFHLE